MRVIRSLITLINDKHLSNLERGATIVVRLDGKCVMQICIRGFSSNLATNVGLRILHSLSQGYTFVVFVKHRITRQTKITPNVIDRGQLSTGNTVKARRLKTLHSIVGQVKAFLC